MQVILVGGFGAPRSLLVPLRRSLTRAGYDADIAPLGFNLACGESAVATLERSIEARGGQMTIIGHSRGGQLGRVLAVRRPDLVSRLISVATPWSIGPPDRVGVRAVTRVVRAVRDRGISVIGAIDCASGDCCARFRTDMNAKPSCWWIALWSSIDRIARGDGRPPTIADVVIDIRTSHVGAVRSPAGIGQVMSALSSARYD